jgi:tyrosine-protein kinase Etk/Wzc
MDTSKAEAAPNGEGLAAVSESVVREVLKRLSDSAHREEFDEFDDVPYRGGNELHNLLRLLFREWKLLLWVTVAGAVVATLVAIALPNMYTATALILPPAKPQSLSGALLGQLGGMAGAIVPSLGLKDPSDMYVGILRSRSICDDLVQQFRLQQIYSTKTTGDARLKLLDRASFALGKDSMLRLSVEDRDPKLAAALANAFIAELNKQNNLLAITESAQRRLFFEREVAAEKDALAAAEGLLKQIQQRTGVFEVSSQAQVVIGSIARLRAEIVIQEVALQRLQMGATAANPEVAKQEKELTALRAELSKLEAGDARQRAGDPMVPLASVPQASLDYLRALRDVKYHNSLFEVLSKEYEAARIDEAKEAPVIQVVDLAIPPEIKSGPPRTLFALLGAALSTVAGAIFVYFFRSRRRAND